MTLSKIAGFVATVATLSLISSSALAGTVVTNTTTNRTAGGTGHSEFASSRNSVGIQDNYSQSLKVESLAPGQAQ